MQICINFVLPNGTSNLTDTAATCSKGATVLPEVSKMANLNEEIMQPLLSVMTPMYYLNTIPFLLVVSCFPKEIRTSVSEIMTLFYLNIAQLPLICHHRVGNLESCCVFQSYKSLLTVSKFFLIILDWVSRKNL